LSKKAGFLQSQRVEKDGSLVVFFFKKVAVILAATLFIILLNENFETHRSDDFQSILIAKLLTDREAADLNPKSRTEIEDHFGDAQFFKRYIINYPQRVA